MFGMFQCLLQFVFYSMIFMVECKATTDIQIDVMVTNIRDEFIQCMEIIIRIPVFFYSHIEYTYHIIYHIKTFCKKNLVLMRKCIKLFIYINLEFNMILFYIPQLFNNLNIH